MTKEPQSRRSKARTRTAGSRSFFFVSEKRGPSVPRTNPLFTAGCSTFTFFPPTKRDCRNVVALSTVGLEKDCSVKFNDTRESQLIFRHKVFSLPVSSDFYLPLSRSLFRNKLLYYEIYDLLHSLSFLFNRNSVREVLNIPITLEFWLIQVLLSRVKFCPISRTINSVRCFIIAIQKKKKRIFDETQIDLLQQILIIFRNQLGRVLILRSRPRPRVRK